MAINLTSTINEKQFMRGNSTWRVSGAILAVVVCIVSGGCTHTTLRQTLEMGLFAKVDESTTLDAARRRFPVGRSVEAIKSALPHSTPPPAWLLWWPFDLWMWNEVNTASPSEPRNMWTPDVDGHQVVIDSFHFFVWGAMRYIELQIEFRDDKLVNTVVKERGRAL